MRKQKVAFRLETTLGINYSQQWIYSHFLSGLYFQTIKEKLTENPITREAIHEHHRLREQEMLARPTISPASILARMARKRPLTKTEMMVRWIAEWVLVLWDRSLWKAEYYSKCQALHESSLYITRQLVFRLRSYWGETWLGLVRQIPDLL